MKTLVTCNVRRDAKKINSILFDFYKKYSLPGGISMAISYKEKLVYAGSLGYADRKHNIPLTPEHRIRIASISKSITSIAIMKLTEERKIGLDDGDKLIQQVLAQYPLKNLPNLNYEYSNFGYCILGRVIEKISGMPYEDYVKMSILVP